MHTETIPWIPSGECVHCVSGPTEHPSPREEHEAEHESLGLLMLQLLTENKLRIVQ